jgi:hypothetical protein
MDIVFKEKKFENECNSQRLLKKQYGEKMAKKIRQRLDDLYHFSKVMTDLVDYSKAQFRSRTGIVLLDVSHDYWKLVLKAVIVLEEMRSLPGRCHELLHNRAGQLSLDLVHPLRLIFEPANIPIPQKADGGIDWKKVTAVVIIGIDDTHD